MSVESTMKKDGTAYLALIDCASDGLIRQSWELVRWGRQLSLKANVAGWCDLRSQRLRTDRFLAAFPLADVVFGVCEHPMLHVSRGPRVPLRYGSSESLVCDICKAHRLLFRDGLPWNPGPPNATENEE